MKNKVLIAFLALAVTGILVAFAINYNKKLSTPAKALQAYNSVYFNMPPSHDYSTYYWFSIVLQINPNNSLKIVGLAGGISKGMINDFNKAVWRGLAHRRIVIGPFLGYDDAKKAQYIYKKMAKIKSEDQIDKIKWPKYNHEIYWFALKISELERLGIFVIEHSPARVEPGDVLKFVHTLFVTLVYQQITIGPFEDYQRTEDIKRMYRQNE